MNSFKLSILACAIVLIVPAMIVPSKGTAAERAKAKVTCQPTAERLVYDCMIMLTGRKSGKPIDGAKIMVNADMPSMAMVHNIQPVEAVATGMPGMYRLRITLEMMGNWALRLKVSGPLRDLVIAKYNFGTEHGMPAGHSGSNMSGSPSSPGMSGEHKMPGMPRGKQHNK